MRLLRLDKVAGAERMEPSEKWGYSNLGLSLLWFLAQVRSLPHSESPAAILFELSALPVSSEYFAPAVTEGPEPPFLISRGPQLDPYSVLLYRPHPYL